VTTRILAVCAGNICRSPAAEAAIRAAAEDAGVDVEVDSAGTGSWSIGNPPHPQAVDAGARAGLQITGRARRMNRADFDRFDVIVVMDRANLRDVMESAPSLEARAKVRLFRTFDPHTVAEEIADPYGGPKEGYETTIEQVTAAASGLIATLKSSSMENSVAIE
jgi:protein-tyrosine phosphatase